MAKVTNYKPRPDTYDAIEVECEYGNDDRPNQLDCVRVRWYEDGALKISVKGGAPAMLSRCYLEGQGRDVILRVEPTQSPAREAELRRWHVLAAGALRLCRTSDRAPRAVGLGALACCNLNTLNIRVF